MKKNEFASSSYEKGYLEGLKRAARLCDLLGDKFMDETGLSKSEISHDRSFRGGLFSGAKIILKYRRRRMRKLKA